MRRWIAALWLVGCGTTPAASNGGNDASIDATVDATVDGAAVDADAMPPFVGNLPRASWGHALSLGGVAPYGIAIRDDGHIILGLRGASAALSNAQIGDFDSTGVPVATHTVCPMQGDTAFSALGAGDTFSATYLTGTYYALSYGRTTADGGLAFQRQIGGTSQSDFGNAAPAVALASDGNAYVAAPFTGTVDFDAGPVNGSLVMAKLGPTGSTVWSVGWSADKPELAVDGSGNLVLGATTGTQAVDFGGGPLTGSVLAEFAPDAGHVWSRNTPGSTQVRALATSPSGFVAVLGASSTLDGVATAPGPADLDIALLDQGGGVTWAKRIALDQSDSTPIVLARGLDGTYVVSRSGGGTMDFGNGPLFGGCAIADYSASGVLLYAGVLKNCEAGVATTIASGDLVVAGELSGGNVDLGNGVVITYDPQHLAFLAELHP